MSSLSSARDSPSRVPLRDTPSATVGSDSTPTLHDSPHHRRRKYQFRLIGGIALITAGLIFTVMHLLDQVERSRMVQVAVLQVELHANLIRSVEWEAIATGNVAPASRAEFRHGEREIFHTTQALVQAKPQISGIQVLAAACSEYVRDVKAEIALIGAGQFVQARSFDTREVAPRFDTVLRLVRSISQEQSQTAERQTLTSRIGLVTAALFWTATMLWYFRRFHIQQHRADMALAEQAVARENEDRFRTLSENSADIILVVNAPGKITYISPSVNLVLGGNDHAALGTSLFQWLHPDDAALTRAALDAVVALDGASTIEFRLLHATGGWLDFECRIRNLLHDPNIQGLVLNARNITQDKKAQATLDFSAAHDLLTKLPNRALFMDRLEKVIERKKRHPGANAAVLFLDLDDLKMINDGMGHDAGDHLIREFGQRMRACVREEDTLARPLDLRIAESRSETVARLGGDEFIILLEEVNDPSDAIRVAQRIQAAMAEPFVIQGQEIFKSVSIGIAFSSDETDARSIVANADTAMYRAKTNGKSCFEVFDSAMHAQIARRLDLEKSLRGALESNEFRLHYQPIVFLATGVAAGFEALVRWERPDIGLVPPDEFIRVAEEIGLIVPLGQWVLMEACRQAVKWERDSSGLGPYVGVNVSARQFAYPAFVDQVKDALRATGLNPHRLKVELTEGTAMVDPERAVDLMLELAELGVTLSLDDFGTGYSSLSVLRRFPVKTIKIDRSFIAAIHTNSQVAAIVATIIGLARVLCMEVVAEGLENFEQLEKLQSAACDCAQGYLFSVPLSADDVPSVIGINLMAKLEGKRSRVSGAGH